MNTMLHFECNVTAKIEREFLYDNEKRRQHKYLKGFMFNDLPFKKFFIRPLPPLKSQ